MRKTLSLLAVLLLSGLRLLAQNCGPVPPADNTVYPWCYKINEGTTWNTAQYKAYIINGLPFRLLFPKDYDSTTVVARRYPLVILLHGIGENGTDNNLQLKYGGKNHLDALNNGSYDGFVMVPQAPQDLWGSSQRATLLKFIEVAIRELKVDQFRVQLEGYSGGGTAAWKLAYDHPLVFAATIPMSSANSATANVYAQVLKYTAVWHAQGGRDTRPPATAGNAVATAFRNAGANYRYQYYHELGHGTWGAMYREPDFFPFLMRNSMLRIHALYFKYNFCNGEAVTGVLGVKQGFEGYEWRKNGSLAAGANANELNFSGIGQYTVRIKHKGLWSEWSAPISIQQIAPTATPAVVASGPTALPSLDGGKTVVLRAPKGYQSYLWSTGAVTDSLVVSRAGTYHVQVTEAYGCPSVPSAPVKVTFNVNNAVVAPSQLMVATNNETSLNLSWKDNSTNESGVEVYRRAAPDASWALVAQLPANSTSYTDQQLQHFTRYYYSIRAVNSDGGSSYASGSGKTAPDVSAPTAPAALSVTRTSRTSVGLSWESSPTTVRYEIYGNNKTVLLGTSTQTEFLVENLAERQFYNFSVRAVDGAGNTSEFSNQVTAGTFINGLYYTYYEGELTTVYNIPLLDKVNSGSTPNVDILTFRNRNDHYAFVFEGYLSVPSTGSYTFFTTSDDGSTLSINGVEVVNNNGRHGRQERSGTISLTAGIHSIKVLYFESTGTNELLEVRWQGPGMSKQLLPDAALKEAFTVPTPPAAPTSTSAVALDHQRILLKWTDNSTNESGIEIHRSTSNAGTYTVVSTLAPNTTQYTDAQLNAGTTYYYKIRAIGTSGESGYAGLGNGGVWLNATTQAGAATPLAPTALTVFRTGTTAAQLGWQDNAYNETAYEVWRSTDGTNFSRLVTTGPNITHHSDNTITSSNGFYYRVKAVTNNNSSDWSPTAQVSSQNKPPLIEGLPAVASAPAGSTSEISFTVRDPEGVGLLYFSRHLPAFARIEKVNATTAKLILTPRIGEIGFYSGLQFTASDGVLETDISFSVSIKDNEKTSIYVNTGNSSVAGKPWNNTNTYGGVSNKVVLRNMLDENGTATGYSLTLVDAWTSNKAYGETSGNDSGIYPDVVTSSAYIIGPGKTVRFKVSGLSPQLRYNFVFFGSSIYKSNNGSTLYTIGNQTVGLAVQSNISKTVQINGVQADANGEIVVTVRGASDATKGGYLNAFVIEQYPNHGSLLRPGRFTAHAVSGTEASLSWTDNSYQETGFEVWRRTLPSGSYAKIATTPANSTSYSDTGLMADMGYEYKVRAVNGSSASDYAAPSSISTLLFQVLINANFTRNAGLPWNNLDRRPTTGATWYNFMNNEEASTGIHLRLDESFDGNNAYGPNANGQGIYPDNVIKTFYFNEIGIVAKLRLFGLDDRLTYNFRFFGSSAFSGGENGVSEYRIGNKKTTLDVQNNLRNTAVIRDVRPSNGSVVIEVEAGAYARYGYLNALVIEARDDSKLNGSGSATSARSLAEATPDVVSSATALFTKKVSVYPNPSRHELFVTLTATAAGKHQLQVLDLSGRLLHLQEVDVVAGENLIKVDLTQPAIAKGLYLLKVQTAGAEPQVIRFLKE